MILFTKKTLGPITKKTLGPAVVSLGLFSPSIQADTDSNELWGNVLGTGIMSVITGYIKKDIHTWEDASRHFAYGAAAGYGFHQAKKAIGEGNEDWGVAIGYLSASVLENVTLDEHPLGFFRYGAGPFEIRVATPFAKHKNNWVNFDIDVFETYNALKQLRSADNIGFRYGAIYGVTEEEIQASGFETRIKGLALGRTILINEEFADPNSRTWRHEAVHSMQALQFSSVLDVGRTYTYETVDKHTDQPDLFGVHLRGNALYGAFTAAQSLIDYRDQWSEIEAFHYTGDVRDFDQPTHRLHNIVGCQ